jgi:hypothetical protein
MARTRVLVGVSIAIVVGIVVLVRGNDDEETGDLAVRKRNASIATRMGSNDIERAAVPGAPATLTPQLLAARGRALADFQAQLVRHVQACQPTAPKTPAQPRAVRFAFELEPARSTPDLQFVVVRDATVIDTGGLSKTARECVEHTIGMPMVFVAPQLPDDMRTFVETILIPVS